MIAVDTSALMAIVLDDERSQACRAALTAEERILISAGTLVELSIVSLRRRVNDDIALLIDELPLDVIPVTRETAQRIYSIYAHWGKGMHRASLNLGDCFAYDVATQHDCPLLYVGDDFSKTDVKSVL